MHSSVFVYDGGGRCVTTMVKETDLLFTAGNFQQ